MERIIAFVVAFWIVPALAQNAITQSGSIVVNEPLVWSRDHTARSSGGLAGYTGTGQGLAPFSVTDLLGLGVSFNSAVTTGPYNALAFGHDSSGNGLITLDSYNGYVNKALKVRINGVTYDFPGAGNGNVVGPTPTPTANEVALWNGGLNLIGSGAASVTAVNIGNATAPITLKSNTTINGITGTGTALTITQTFLNPATIMASADFRVTSSGSNSGVRGGAALYTLAQDDVSVTSSTKGYLYGANVGIAPRVARNNAGVDDADGLVISNSGTASGTEGIFMGHLGTTAKDWISAVTLDVVADWGLLFGGNGSFVYGIDLRPAAFSGAPIRLPNNKFIVARNAANSADIGLISLTATDGVFIGGSGIQTTVGGNLLISGTGALTVNSATMITTTTSFTNGAGAQTATLTNSPSVGNPTKWIPISDNGVTRHIPAW